MEEAHALDAARVDAESASGRKLALEDHRVPEPERKGLVDRGHTIEGRGQYEVWFRQVVQMVGFKPDGRQFAASDPRYDGGAKVREPL